MKQAILIGCGKIGAGYDFNRNDLILTHAKAYFFSKQTHLYKVIDQDINLAKKVALQYNCKYAKSITKEDIQKCDIISIAVPTELHFEILEYLYANHFRGKIILEKPALSNEKEINQLLRFDKKFLDQITINYIRRFDKTYIKILHQLKTKKFGKIEKIEANIFGTMLHNGVHIINILNYLFGVKPKILFVSKQTTLLKYHETEVIINSLNTPYINFDITFFTKKKKIVFNKLGYRLSVYKTIQSTQFHGVKVLKKVSKQSILHSYALDMIDAVLNDKKTSPTLYEGIEDMKIVKEIECWQ